MKKKQVIISIMVLSVILCSPMAKYAHAETGIAKVTGRDLVDSGKHMDYTINSKYDAFDEGAAQTWNFYLGVDVIRKDIWNTVNDCSIYDVTDSGVTWVGRVGINTNSLPLPGIMELNTYYMDQLTATKKGLVIKHEFGHTLGLDENDCSDLNIMYPSAKYSNINLTIHDKASVDLAKKSW